MKDIGRLLWISIPILLVGCASPISSIGVRSEPTGAKIFYAGVEDPEVIPVGSNLGAGQQAVTDSNMAFNWDIVPDEQKILVQWPDGLRSEPAVIRRFSGNWVVIFKRGMPPEMSPYTQP